MSFEQSSMNAASMSCLMGCGSVSQTDRLPFRTCRLFQLSQHPLEPCASDCRDEGCPKEQQRQDSAGCCQGYDGLVVGHAVNHRLRQACNRRTNWCAASRAKLQDYHLMFRHLDEGHNGSNHHPLPHTRLWNLGCASKNTSRNVFRAEVRPSRQALRLLAALPARASRAVSARPLIA